ncbi:MAG: transposase [Candidatus Nitrosocosmicus sp.]|nr:transposase [Candidatus Nitrosocosmicus sp.]MDN5866531.1 transposase [Candidatus Nitrosocosmicus sp.]
MICVQTKEEKVRNDQGNTSHPTIITVPDKLWDEFKKILPREKPPKTVGRPVVPYRRVLDGILYVLEQDAGGKCFPKNTVLDLSTCHRRFQEWKKLDLFKKTWVKLLEIYDEKVGIINWTWQALDSISIKSPLGGEDDWKQSYY